jgi:hypothetical protein
MRLKSDSQEYCRFVSLAREELYQILTDKRVMLHAALLSVLEALKEDPGKQVLIHDSLEDPLYLSPSIPFGLDRQQYRQLSLEMVLEISEQFFEKLINSCVSHVVSSPHSDLFRFTGEGS